MDFLHTHNLNGEKKDQEIPKERTKQFFFVSEKHSMNLKHFKAFFFSSILSQIRDFVED